MRQPFELPTPSFNLPYGVSERDFSEDEHTCAECGTDDLDGDDAVCESCKWAMYLAEPVIYTVYTPQVGSMRQVYEQREETISYMSTAGRSMCSRSTCEAQDIEDALYNGRDWLARNGRKAVAA